MTLKTYFFRDDETIDCEVEYTRESCGALYTSESDGGPYVTTINSVTDENGKPIETSDGKHEELCERIRTGF